MTAADPRLGRWLEAVLAEPGLTAVRDPGEARRVLVDDALASAGLVEEGPVVDVGSGGGSPGIPLAAARPELHVDLLEGQRRKCSFLERAATAFANVGVVCARAEEHGRGAGREAYGTAVAQALAPPVRTSGRHHSSATGGGRVILLAGEVDLARAAAAAAAVGGGVPEEVPLPGGEHRRLLVVLKIAPTPARFPRRPGMARKRPLA